MPHHQHRQKTIDTRWNPGQYLKFSDHRLRPAIELLERVPLRSAELIYDLGCGSGNVTRIIKERWSTATVYGLDSSREMLEKAKGQPGNIRWIASNIETWVPDEKPDLLFSNAALHWVEDHYTLFPRLINFLKKGGCLAVQMPLSWPAPSHRLMRETLANGGISGRPLGSEALRKRVARKWVEDTEVYYDLLNKYTRSLDIWETEYLQALEGDDPVLEWVKGSGLRPILNGLGDGEREIFLSEYRQRLRETYRVKPNGCTLYPFRRLFIVAVA